MAFDWDRQFEIASEKVRDLMQRRISGEVRGADFKREIGSLDADELGQLTALLLKAPLRAKPQNRDDPEGLLFERT